MAAIGITLCFFILLLSFDASIRQVQPPPPPPLHIVRLLPPTLLLLQSAWEFGVLRSLGVTQAQLTRCFVYETVRAASASRCCTFLYLPHAAAGGVHVRLNLQRHADRPWLRGGAHLPAGDV